MTTIDRTKLKTLQQREESRFLADHPKSAALYNRAQSSLLGGVPMNWMKKWAGAFPVFVKSANLAHITDVDNREYIDLCLGDTGAMTGHSPEIVADVVAFRCRHDLGNTPRSLAFGCTKCHMGITNGPRYGLQPSRICFPATHRVNGI